MADRFGTIVVSSPPRGVYQPCIISGTPKPGTCMTVKGSTEPTNGVFTYEAFNRDADSDRAEVAVLVEDKDQGRDVTTAFVASDHAKVYFPAPGELLQMLLSNVAGTSDSFVIGNRLIIDDGTGKLLITTGSPEMEPFQVMETVSTALTADTLVLCMYTGH